MRNTILLFACFLLFITPVYLHAQDEPQWPQPARNKAWLSVNIDLDGVATVAFELPVEAQDREQLKRSLAESFSFPLQFRDMPAETIDSDVDEMIEESGSQHPWTSISARSPQAFSGRMKSTCKLDLHSLLAQLQQHQIDYLKVTVFFQNETQGVEIKGAHRLRFGNITLDHYEVNVDVRAGTFPVIQFSRGYSAGDILKRCLPLILFLLLPAMWTRFVARKSGITPEELWGRHLRFLHRLLNVVWIAWLPIYFFSGVDRIFWHAFGVGRLAQIVDVSFYFIPPVIAMFLCHFASRRVYEQVPAVDWSPRQVVRHAVIANALSLIPMFLLILGMNTFSSSPRQAALYVIIGYIGFIVLSQNTARLLGSRLHALSSGDLRDRIFDLAHRADVKLQQVYVLPESRAQLSNAFARSDNSVMITDSLLKNLSRREVDGIMAHEIGHLQAKHPQTSTTISIVIMATAGFVGTMITKFANLQGATPFVFAAAVGIANLVLFFRSRRNERQADALGIGLTGDPEAFISGLAKLTRLNVMPLHSGGWGESLDTHPGTMSRFQQIATAHGISESRLQELVTDAEPPQDRYPSIDAEVDATVFSSEFKNKYRLRVTLVVLGALLLVPVPFAAALVRDEMSVFAILSLAIAGFVCSFGFSLVLRNRIAFWGYPSLCQHLKTKLDKRGLGDVARYGTLVGLAPAPDSRKYEGYPFWDIGVFWLTKEKLYFVGEQCEFALTREQVREVYSRDTTPEWIAEKSLFIRWKDYPEGLRKTLHFVATGEASVLKARRAIDSLQNRVQAWMYQREDFPPASSALESITSPCFPEITSTSAPMKFDPRLVFKAAMQLFFYAAIVGFAIRLSYMSIAYMAVVAFLLTFVDELSRALKDKQPTSQIFPAPATFEAGTYQAGSWKNA